MRNILLNLKLCLIVSSIIFTPMAISGPWISSGGNLLKDARNPWFLFNTPSIRYCIKIDSISTTAKVTNVREAIKKSLNFWKREFQENKLTDVSNSMALKLDIPNFIEVSCNGHEDLAILLGENSLNSQQKSFIETNHSDSIAAAIRTDYDRVNLRAKGFIYLAGDKNKASWGESAWSDMSRLSAVVAHELGHVFGVPHMQGDYVSITNNTTMPLALNLMSENLPQSAVLAATEMGFDMSKGILPILSSMKDFKTCNVSQWAKDWLKVDGSVQCFKIILSDSQIPSDTFASVYALLEDGRTILIGQFKQGGRLNPLISSKFDIITQVFLTSEQNVFRSPEIEVNPNKTIVGGTQIYASLNLQYISVIQPIPKAVIVNMSPMQFSVIGISDQSFIDILSVGRIRPLISNE